MDASQYNYAIVEYSCERCLIGNNFIIIFDFNKDKDIQEQNELPFCSHMDLTFTSSLENRCFNLSIEFHCKNCDNYERRTFKDGIFSGDVVNLNCKCNNCQNGDTNIGVLFMNKKSNEQNFNQLNKIEEKNNDDKISIFDIIDDEEEKKILKIIIIIIAIMEIIEIIH